MTLPIPEHGGVRNRPVDDAAAALQEQNPRGAALLRREGAPFLPNVRFSGPPPLPSPSSLPPFLLSWSGNLTVSDAHARMTLGAADGSEEFEHGQITLRLKFLRFEVDPAAAVKWSA